MGELLSTFFFGVLLYPIAIVFGIAIAIGGIFLFTLVFLVVKDKLSDFTRWCALRKKGIK